ncbi:MULTISPECIES: glycosyltransferase family 9 protein [Marinomonas]|uniref:Glycosyltransferase family 9 protein n=1 Tax=Marinomonas arctica TaxID=383750 RepID=A0A7H1J3G3_9GAMM|nr:MULTISPECIES: glycosyltransferase family 9 protein [Marinomonas]QNT05029.1 glycosyltransferase family 9 protein [Marinomonas arctica]
MSEVNKILVVRNDKIGDFVLALPAIQAIKSAFPNATLIALVPDYTKEIAQAFAWIDDIIIDPKDPKNKKALVTELKNHNFDAVICLFSDAYNATLVRQAKIPMRVAPATKWVQFLYTHRLSQRRSKSLKPEFEYNVDLAHYFIELLGGKVQKAISPMFSYASEDLTKQLHKLDAIGVSVDRKLCFIHPVTGGSSNTLTQAQWVKLIIFLDGLDHFHFVITAGPGEAPVSQALVEALQGLIGHVSLYDKNDGIADFMCSIATAALFVAGSTGPLHIAGAIDVPTIGFYPNKRSSKPLRWKTLNTEGRWLPFTTSDPNSSLTDLDVTSVFEEIKVWYMNL